MRIGIVIPTHNAALNIGPILNDIRHLTYKNIHTIVVDNASQDATVAIIKRSFPEVTLIINSENLNYTIANNQGIRQALALKSDYILLLNDDTEIAADLIETLLRPFATHRNIASSGCIITYYDNPNKIWFAGGFLHQLWAYTTHPHMNQDLATTHLSDQETDFITAVCVMIPARLFTKLGLFDQRYRIFFDEVAWSYQATQKGYKHWLIAKPLVKHKVSSTTGVKGTNRLTPFRAYYYARNPFILVKDHFTGWNKWTGFIGQCVVRLPFYSWQMLRHRDWQALKAYLRGLSEGIVYFFS